MTRRGLLAGVVVLAWLAGLGAYARRESSRTPQERLAEAAMRVAPGATYYTVEVGGAHVGFASSTIDTVASGIQVTDYLVADVRINGTLQRGSAQSIVHLTRALALRDFSVSINTTATPIAVSGQTSGDTLLTYVVTTGGRPGDTTRVRFDGPLLLPTIVPLALALGSPLTDGRAYIVAAFDPATMSSDPLNVRVGGESTFVVADSALYDREHSRWVRAHSDTVLGRRLTTGGAGSGLDGWVDDLGRMIEVRGAGFVLKRSAYEIAFENWRASSQVRRESVRDAAGDVRQTTALAASASLSDKSLATLRLRLTGVDLTRFRLADNVTRLGDTLVVSQTDTIWMLPSYSLSGDRRFARLYERYLRAEPLIETDDPSIRLLSQRLRGGESNPRLVAERLAQWVHDSLGKEPTPGAPSAVQVLERKAGDCNEHTLLFVALARAQGIPTRTASGLVRVGGTFYYHAWPEIWLRRWIPIDPTLGQFPADASHIRLLVGGLQVKAELLRIIDAMDVEVIDSSERVATKGSREGQPS